MEGEGGREKRGWREKVEGEGVNGKKRERRGMERQEDEGAGSKDRKEEGKGGIVVEKGRKRNINKRVRKGAKIRER